MKLYHGTSEKRVKKILAEGLKPRHMTGKSNWKHTIESNPKAVYLTDAYPIYFAYQCSDENERLAIIEVDTDRLDLSKLHPDEDVLEQVGRNYDELPKNWGMVKRTRHYRKQAEFNPNWKKSLDIMGTCGYYGHIPREAISRVAYLDVNKLDVQFLISLIDCTITWMNYRIVGHQYKARTNWLFGEPFDVKDVAGFVYQMEGEEYDKTRQFYDEQVKNRSGIEIVENKLYKSSYNMGRGNLSTGETIHGSLAS